MYIAHEQEGIVQCLSHQTELNISEPSLPTTTPEESDSGQLDSYVIRERKFT